MNSILPKIIPVKMKKEKDNTKNNIKFFENEANTSLIRGYLRGNRKMEKKIPSISWDSNKWISFINCMLLDYYGVKLVALSNTCNNRDVFRLQTTVVTPFHLAIDKGIQTKLGIALMTCETDFLLLEPLL